MNKHALFLSKESDVSFSLLVILAGVLVALPSQPLSLILLLVMANAIYQKEVIAYLLFTISVLCSAIIVNNTYMIIGLTFLLFDFICIKGYDLIKLVALPYMKYWNSILCLLVFYLLERNLNAALVYAMLSFILHYFCFEQQQKEEKVLWFSVCNIIYLLVSPFLMDYVSYLPYLYIALLALFFGSNLVSITCVYFLLQGINPLYVLFVVFLSNHKEPVWLTFLLALVYLLYDSTFVGLSAATSLFIIALFSNQQHQSFQLAMADSVKEHEVYLQHSFYQQIAQYSHIFYELSDYYKNTNVMMADLLSAMGEALSYNAKLSRHYVHQKEDVKKRISDVLHGYQFQLLQCECSQNTKKIQVELVLLHLYANELEEVIVPLISSICECQLHIVSTHTYPLQKEKIHVVLESEDFNRIETYANTIGMKEVSGDAYASFQLEDTCVCMLSDGMGSGSEANRLSGSLVSIMEALLKCHIPIYEAIAQINAFLHSDVFATLDVLCFDRKNNKAYLSKNASAPTYLLRDNTLHEMSAHSLPIGIVEHIKADIYELTFQKGDVFIMISDGISKEEVNQWLALQRCKSVKNEGINMTNLLHNKQRKDDSTFMMVKVH